MNNTAYVLLATHEYKEPEILGVYLCEKSAKNKKKSMHMAVKYNYINIEIEEYVLNE